MKTEFVLITFVFVTLACSVTKSSLPTVTETSPMPTITTTRNTPATPSTTPTMFPETPTPPILSFPTIEAPQFTALQMINGRDGWAVTENAILRTNDGGATWYDISMSSGEILGYGTPFSFLDAAEAWVIEPDSQDPIYAGTLHHTQDGGLNWHAMPVPFGNGKLTFLDKNKGWMMVNLGVGAGSMGVSIFQTTDGGFSWTEVYTNDPNRPNASDSLPLGGLKNNLVALDLQTAWIAGVIYAPDTIYLYKTTDGGKTWALQPLPMVPGLQNIEVNTIGPIFLSENYAVLPVQFFGDTMQTGFFISKDSGESWEFSALLPGLGKIDLVSPSDGFYWSGEDLFVSADRGQTWSQITPSIDFGESLVLIDFVNAQKGWALTFEEGQTVLYKTEDGGINWKRISP